MNPGPDLQVDTGWIRQSAATLEHTGRALGAAAPSDGPVLATAGLGSDPGAVAVARLVALRCAQAKQATDQLAAVAAGLSQQLTMCADAFDRLETGFRWPR